MDDIMLSDRFVARDEPGWHKLGTVFTEPLSASEAIALGKLGYVVHKVPLYAAIGEIDGTSEPFALDKVALMRSPVEGDDSWQNFGVVAPEYGLLQNARIGELLDPLTDKWPVATAAALGKGETFFLTLRAGEYEVGGISEETLKLFLAFVDDKTGHRKARFMLTPERIVCRNTLNIGIRRAVVDAQLEHHEGADAEIEWRVKLMGKLQNMMTQQMQSFDAMASKRISLKLAKLIVDAAYPMPQPSRKLATLKSLSKAERKQLPELVGNETELSKSFERMCQLVTEKRELAMRNVKRVNDISPQIAETPYAAFNAIVEVEDWCSPDDAGTLASLLFGQRAEVKELAYVEALRLSS